MNEFQEAQIKQLILSASRGNREAGIELIKQYVDTVFAGKTPNKYVLDYVAYGLNDILDGEDPKNVLNIERPDINPKIPEEELIDIAVLVELQVRRNTANKVKAPVQKAVQAVAEDIGWEYVTVRNIRNKYGETAKLIADKRLRK